jgi:hypothetical protein
MLSDLKETIKNILILGQSQKSFSFTFPWICVVDARDIALKVDLHGTIWHIKRAVCLAGRKAAMQTENL